MFSPPHARKVARFQVDINFPLSAEYLGLPLLSVLGRYLRARSEMPRRSKQRY